FEAAKALDLLALFFSQILLKGLAQPVIRNHLLQQLIQTANAFKITGKCQIKTVVVFFILDQTGACQQVKILLIGKTQIGLQGTNQIQQLTRSCRYTCSTNFLKKIN